MMWNVSGAWGTSPLPHRASDWPTFQVSSRLGTSYSAPLAAFRCASASILSPVGQDRRGSETVASGRILMVDSVGSLDLPVVLRGAAFLAVRFLRIHFARLVSISIFLCFLGRKHYRRDAFSLPPAILGPYPRFSRSVILPSFCFPSFDIEHISKKRNVNASSFRFINIFRFSREEAY